MSDRIEALRADVEKVGNTLDKMDQKVDNVKASIDLHTAREEVIHTNIDTRLEKIDSRLDVYNASLIDHMARTRAVEVTNERLATVIEKMDARLAPIETDRATKVKIASTIKWTLGVLAAIATISLAIYNILL